MSRKDEGSRAALVELLAMTTQFVPVHRPARPGGPNRDRAGLATLAPLRETSGHVDEGSKRNFV